MSSSLDNISVQYVKGVGPQKKKLFANLGVATIEELFYLFPRRYEDRRHLVKLAQVVAGENQSVRGKVMEGEARKSWYTKKHVFEITLDDGTGKLKCVWFNQPFHAHYLQPGCEVVAHGKVIVYKDRLQMVSPEYELIDGDDKESLSLNRIVPMYPLTKGMTHRFLRRIVRSALDKYREELADELPVMLRNKHRFFNIKRSLENIHFPESDEAQTEAMRRISFEEFYFFQIAVMLRRLSITHKSGHAHTIGEGLADEFGKGLPFKLTGAQRRAIEAISADMRREEPMLRLLQGDVGCGKTLVALFGVLVAAKNSHQAAIMVPTEILANQHFQTVQRLIREGPLKGIKAALLVSSLKDDEKDKLRTAIKKGKVDLVIGTHALISDNVEFKDLSYVVIDEQHKFGVRQRALITRKGSNPDVLIMTATPIPRSLCMTLYGDMDLTVIDEMPSGRGKVVTKSFSHEKDREVYQKVRKAVESGRQAYIVYPIIEESESQDVKAAEQMVKRFKKDEFKGLSAELIHGQMKEAASAKIMEDFKAGKVQVLVATSVLEVGIDVPNASVMVIEHAERFGLAQLHQLRGRIGRGSHESACYLVADIEGNEDAQRRIDAMLSTTDGFKIAQEDLLIRGAGRFFGRHQHGLNELKVADPIKQLDLLELARGEAKALLQEDPKLSGHDHQRILEVVRRRYPGYLREVEAG